MTSITSKKVKYGKMYDESVTLEDFAKQQLTDIGNGISTYDKPILRILYSKKLLDLKKYYQIWSYVLRFAMKNSEFLKSKIN